jgi:hypothetical protein
LLNCSESKFSMQSCYREALKPGRHFRVSSSEVRDLGFFTVCTGTSMDSRCSQDRV